MKLLANVFIVYSAQNPLDSKARELEILMDVTSKKNKNYLLQHVIPLHIHASTVECMVDARAYGSYFLLEAQSQIIYLQNQNRDILKFFSINRTVTTTAAGISATGQSAEAMLASMNTSDAQAASFETKDVFLAFDWSKRDQILVTLTSNKHIYLFDSAEYASKGLVEVLTDIVIQYYGVWYLPKLRLWVTGSDDGRFSLWRIVRHRQQRHFEVSFRLIK